MATKSQKPKFNEPTPTEWIAGEQLGNWVVNGKTFKTTDEDGDPFEYTPLVATIGFGRTNGERKANATIISASREMLEALKVMEQALKVGYINKRSQQIGTWRTYVSIIKQAIAKAEGKKI